MPGSGDPHQEALVEAEALERGRACLGARSNRFCVRWAPPQAPWWRLRQATRRISDGLLEAIRGLHLVILLMQEACAEVAKPEWWSDEGLKALSARVVRAAPDIVLGHQMRALVLRGQDYSWEAGPRSAAELREAATHFDRVAALDPAPAKKAKFARIADECRSKAATAAFV